MESFATGLKRIQEACDNAKCKVEFDKQLYGFPFSIGESKTFLNGVFFAMT